MKLPIPFYWPKLSSEIVQMGNIIFIILGSICILIGLIILLLNRRNGSEIQNNVGIGFLTVGILSMINNLSQYLFWN